MWLLGNVPINTAPVPVCCPAVQRMTRQRPAAAVLAAGRLSPAARLRQRGGASLPARLQLHASQRRRRLLARSLMGAAGLIAPLREALQRAGGALQLQRAAEMRSPPRLWGARPVGQQGRAAAAWRLEEAVVPGVGQVQAAVLFLEFMILPCSLICLLLVSVCAPCLTCALCVLPFAAFACAVVHSPFPL